MRRWVETVEARSRGFEEAVARGLEEMARSILFVALPRALEKAIGPYASATLLLRVFSRSAYDGFREFMKRLSIESLSMMETLEVFTQRFPVEHPFRVFTTVEKEGEDLRLIFEEGVCREADVVSISTIVGAIEGVLRAIGVEVRAVLSEAGIKALCAQGKEMLVVKPSVKSEGQTKLCEVRIEKLRCT